MISSLALVQQPINACDLEKVCLAGHNCNPRREAEGLLIQVDFKPKGLLHHIFQIDLLKFPLTSIPRFRPRQLRPR